MHTNLFKILCFSCQGKSRDIVYQRICLLLWLIFAQHGLFEIQLTVFSAPSRLTDLGIYDITWCGIWLLTIFHIPYIHFQRELRKVTSPKWYLSFFVQYRIPIFQVIVSNIIARGEGLTFIIKVYTDVRLEGHTFQASKYMNGYHFHIKSIISMGYLFHTKVYEWVKFEKLYRIE